MRVVYNFAMPNKQQYIILLYMMSYVNSSLNSCSTLI